MRNILAPRFFRDLNLFGAVAPRDDNVRLASFDTRLLLGRNAGCWVVVWNPLGAVWEKKTENGTTTTWYLHSTVLGGQVVAEINGSGWTSGYVYPQAAAEKQKRGQACDLRL